MHYPSFTCSAATLKRYDDDGRPAGDEHIVELAAKNALYRFQEAIGGVVDNFPVALGAAVNACRRVSRGAAFQAGVGLRWLTMWPSMRCSRVKSAIA